MKIESITLEGMRVRLVPMEEEHIDGLTAAGLHPEIWAYMPVHVESREDMALFVQRALTARVSGPEIPFVIYDKETEAIVGSTRLFDISIPDRHLEIGWTWLSPSAWRTRINTECKYLLLRHAFEGMGAIRVQWKTDSRNVRSQEAIARLGATREGVLRKHRILPNGYIRDSVYFSMLDTEWPIAKERLETRLGQ